MARVLPSVLFLAAARLATTALLALVLTFTVSPLLVGVAGAPGTGTTYGWTRTFGGAADDIVHDVIVDVSGNVYVAGEFVGTVDFDPDPVKTDIHSSHNGTIDAFLAKYSPSGTFLWAKTWGGGPVGGTGFMGRDIASGLGLDRQGNVYVSGHYQYTVDFNPAGGATRTSNAVTMNNVYLSKFAPDGTFEWVRTWGAANGGAEGYSLAVDASDNVYVVGDFSGTSCDFNQDGPTHDVHVNHGFFDAYLVKFASDGTFRWAKTWGGEGYDDGPGVIVDRAGRVYVAGMYASQTIDFDPDGGGVTNHPAHDSGAVVDVFLSKFDSDGRLLWVRTWGGQGGTDAGEALAIDGANNVYVGGRFESVDCDFNPGGTPDLHSSRGAADAFVSKFAPDGTFQWARTWGGSGRDGAGGLAVDGANNVYVTGLVTGTVDVDQAHASGTVTSNGLEDVFLVKWTASGAFRWAETWGGVGTDYAYRMAIDRLSRVYVVGGFRGAVDFDTSAGVDTHVSAGGSDGFLRRVMQAGTPPARVKGVTVRVQR